MCNILNITYNSTFQHHVQYSQHQVQYYFTIAEFSILVNLFFDEMFLRFIVILLVEYTLHLLLYWFYSYVDSYF